MVRQTHEDIFQNGNESTWISYLTHNGYLFGGLPEGFGTGVFVWEVSVLIPM